jgi:hypothetical protein
MLPSKLPPPADLPVVNHSSEIDAADRAIVYCYVEWSGPERFGRPVVLEAVATLRDATSPIPFEFFAIEEDSPAFKDWLVARGHAEYPFGAGTVLWIDSGKCIATEISAAQAGSAQLVSRTESLWRAAS